jgi:hypothetical protein
MRRIGSIFAALGLLLTAACHKPELISSEQLSRPHVVSIIESDPKVIVDPGQPAPNFNSGAMAGGGGGLVGVAVGALVVGAAQGFQTARAGARQSRAQTLEEQLGSTSEIGAELQREFRSALTAEIARGTRMPIQRVESNPRSRVGQAPAAGEETLQLQFGTLLTQDARSVTVQVLVRQMVWKPESERRASESPFFINQLDLVAFSPPIEATSPEIAIGLWRDNNYARLRQATRVLIPEITVLLRMAVLDAEPFDFANLPRVRTNVSPFSLVAHGRRSLLYRGVAGPTQTNFQPIVWGRVVRRTPERGYFVMDTVGENDWKPSDGWIEKPGWAWVSVPAGSL